MEKLSLEHAKSILIPRTKDSHKGTHGMALLIVGSSMAGAAVISARACLRAGVGKLFVTVSGTNKTTLNLSIPEAIASNNQFDSPKDFLGFTAVGIGCGLGLKKSKILEVLFKTKNLSIVIDADALTIIANAKKSKTFAVYPPKTILTPHPGEFDRLFGIHTSTEDRRITAIAKAKQLGVIIVLKGHETLITNGKESFINTTGNAGLAKAGTGDALTGIITSLLAQGYNSFSAAKLGVYLHGLAADIALEKQSVESMLATDVIENLGAAFKILGSSLN